MARLDRANGSKKELTMDKNIKDKKIGTSRLVEVANAYLRAGRSVSAYVAGQSSPTRIQTIAEDEGQDVVSLKLSGGANVYLRADALLGIAAAPSEDAD
jgi:hypothetical protein